jgi:hypothetical protein
LVENGIVKALEGRFIGLEALVTATAKAMNIISIIWANEYSIQKTNEDMKYLDRNMGRLATSCMKATSDYRDAISLMTLVLGSQGRSRAILGCTWIGKLARRLGGREVVS